MRAPQGRNIATLVIAMLLFLTSRETDQECFRRLRDPSLIKAQVNA
jgi:hypothetical protein